MIRLLESLAVGEKTKTRWTHLVTGHLIATLIGIVIAVPLFLTLVYSGGYLNRYMYRYQLNGNQINQALGGKAGILSLGFSTELQISLAVGAVLAVALLIARERLSIFRYINVAALVLFMTRDGIWFWFGALVAFIIQRVVLRIGGMPYYQEKIMPLALGLALGLPVWWVIQIVIWPVRGLMIAGSL